MPQWWPYKSARTIPHTAKSSLKINVEVGLQQHCDKTHACGKKTERKLSRGDHQIPAERLKPGGPIQRSEGDSMV